MGRIKKAAGPKHEATVSPAISEFVATGVTTHISLLPAHLQSFPHGWPFPRGDLYHWIPLLNRFDSILEAFINEYALNDGPQTRPFKRKLLEGGVQSEGNLIDSALKNQEELDSMGYESDGDCELVEVILKHCQTLLENCGNRSLYNSSERLGELLNTTKLSLLSATLQICVRLAQRYYTSRQRVSTASQHMNHALLASHYSIDLEKVQKLANPFARFTPLPNIAPLTNPDAPNGNDRRLSSSRKNTQVADANDLLTLVQGPLSEINDTKGSESMPQDKRWADLAHIYITYYQPSANVSEDQKPPTTPTPARRTSGLSRPSRLSSSEEWTEPLATSKSPTSGETKADGMKHIEISPAEIRSTPIETLLQERLNNVPKDSAYDLLSRVRIASAMLGTASDRQEVVAVRLLAITNLAYIYPEVTFQQKISQPDSEEPRPLQLVHQLTSLLNPPGNGETGIAPKLQTIALGTLEAFSKHKSKEPDVCAALSINVNHGVLFYVLRKALTELSADDHGVPDPDIEERRDAIFSLVEDLPRPSTNRVGETLVAAGLLEILIEALALRTKAAERTFPKILAILHKVIFSPREGLQTFANAKGLDAISNLIAYEVQSSLRNAQNGEGLPHNFRNKMIDYQIPFHQRETLTKLFRNISSMMQNSSGNFDRLLRNFIDSPHLLHGLRTTIINAKIFGAAIWSGAVNIMSSFIHNEPTSYAIIAESGLSIGLLEAISGRSIDTAGTQFQTSGPDVTAGDSGSASSTSRVPTVPVGTGPTSQHEAIVHELAKRKQANLDSGNSMALGILPHVEAILAIPQAFGAICLNHSGMELFLVSGALDRFFEVFESIEHVKALNNSTVDYDTPRILGNAFDELVRHHPNLKASVLASVMTMVDRVTKACERRGASGCGAKLWVRNEKDQVVPAGGRGKTREAFGGSDEDTVMGDAATDAGPTAEPSLLTDDDKEGSNISLIIEIAMRFLAGLFENNTVCSNFIEYHGAEKVLDLATLPCLPYDFNNQAASQEVAKVIHVLAEQKPHLVLPELLWRATDTTNTLRPLCEYNEVDGYFKEFTDPLQQHSNSKAAYGSAVAMSLVKVHTLCNVLYEVFSAPILHPTRVSHTPFSQVNLADVYEQLIQNLGRLHGICVWEEILLQKRLPESWKEATRIKGYGMGSEEADEVFGFISNDEDTVERSSAASNTATTEETNGNYNPPTPKPSKSYSASKDEDTAQFKNARTLRYLLSQIPSCIVPFFQGLGKALANKRRPETYLRQNAHLVAQAMSSSMLLQLRFAAPRNSDSAKDRYAYWIVILTSISQLIIEGSMERPHAQVLTLVLQAFKDNGGLGAITEIMKVFYEEVKSYTGSPQVTGNAIEKTAQATSAYGGIKIILGFYTQITTSKSIIDSSQSQALTSTERDAGHPYFFSASQFLVELRLAILPDIRLLWGFDFVNKASTSIIKCLIEILTTLLEGTEEDGAFKRTSKVPPRRKITQKTYSIAPEKVQFLTSKGFDKDLASEALYRCMSVQNSALEYCQHRNLRNLRMPIPDYDQEKPHQSTALTPERSASGGAAAAAANAQPSMTAGQPDVTDQDTTDAADGLFLLARGGHDAHANDSAMVEVEEADGDEAQHEPMPPPPPPAPVAPEEGEPAGDGMQMSIENLLGLAPEMLAQTQQAMESHLTPEQERSNGLSPSGSRVGSHANGSSTPIDPAKGPPQTTVDDLNDERAEVKVNLVERVLDVLDVHEDVTFELAALIGAAAMNDGEDTSARADIGETLVQALISFSPAMGNEDFRESGKKIAANAHLLGIVLQEEKFFQATLDCLKENMENLISFIKIFPDQGPDQTSPWISSILLVIERELAEDVQPALITWTPPPPDQPVKAEDDAIAVGPSLLSFDVKSQLFDALLDMMPRIGKDEPLVLSVVRTLVILTRSRKLASKLSDKRNIQRLFVMIKQLSGMTNEMLPGTFMILLRHIVEDDETIRQIMRSEILNNFEMRSGRHTDVMGYLRQMHHLVLRSPDMFVEVTNDMCQIAKYDPQQRHPILVLKPELKEDNSPGETPGNAIVGEATLAGDAEIEKAPEKRLALGDEQKGKASESKAPVVEHPSGVIHYLLTELLAYKDVNDKESMPVIHSKEGEATSLDTAEPTGLSSPASPSSTPGAINDSSETKKLEKLEFKLEQHPIYIYRCFILQCLTELLQSYNQIKIEFINFSRKAEPKAVTPSKPRSGVLNYLLNDTIPVGTLNHEDSIAFRKRNNTSNWAISVIVSLCLRTNEAGYEKKHGSTEEDDQPDLLFVRKFVLEHALKAYKDASSSDEHPDIKYARLLDIADLFQRLLMGRLVAPGGPTNQSTEHGVQHSIAKLMYEKNFIAALTGSIADIDLNFPGSKRAVKYILRPLKQLTTTAIKLSQESDISSTLGTTDEDEISTATSVSDIADEREETPDLFRNSTLDMFEPGRNEESESESSDEDDEEMYDEDGDDGDPMEYENEMERDPDEVISDEDEEVRVLGHMEGLHGDAGMDVEVVIDDEDEDEDDEEEEDDDEDADDSEDELDEDGDVEVIDEITGDDENASLAEGDDVDWEDDLEGDEDMEDGGDYEVEGEEVEGGAETAVRDIIEGLRGPNNPLAAFGGAIGGLEQLQRQRLDEARLAEGPSDLQMDIDSGRYMDDVIPREDDDDEEDEDEEEHDVDEEDEEAMYNPAFDEDGDGMPDPPWGFDPDDDPFLNDPLHNHHHHHHHHRHIPRRFQDSWTAFPGGPPGLRSAVPLYRSHRPVGSTIPPNDDGANPLLRRSDRDIGSFSRGNRPIPSDAAANVSDYWVHGMELGGATPRMVADSPVSFVNSIIAAIGNGSTTIPTMAGNAPIHIQFGGAPGTGRGAIATSNRDLPRELQTLLGTRHHHRESARAARDQQPQLAVILPQPTYRRWQEESRLLFSTSATEKAIRVVNLILRLLVPPAIERKRQEMETTKRLKEEQDKKEQERQAKEKAEQVEREKKEKEEREAAERAELEAQHAAALAEAEEENEAEGDDQEAIHATESAEDSPMEGAEGSRNDGPEAPTDTQAEDGEPSQPVERIMTRLGDHEIDITGLGIDLAYLDALPEDIRQEVLMSQIAIQRSQAAETGQPPTEISGEFLEALPPEIREELLQQEAADRRRRERQEAQRQAAAAGGDAPRAEDMDPASFFASLEPTLRQHVLMEQDEDMLAHLPAEIAAEARALGGERGMHRFAGMPGRGPRGLARQMLDDAQRAVRHTHSPLKKPPRKQVVQMLDKAGVATLLRLMFVPQQGSSRESFNAVLRNISENRQNRAEVVSLLLSILQDGSVDVNAVERSFNHLSLRAKQPRDQKTPQPAKRTLTGSALTITSSVEVTPLTVIQQCLSTLVALTQHNPHIPSFFLTEHDLSSGMKNKSSRKGKGKDTRAQKYPLNALLSLLDRQLIMESSGCLEQLASLLQSVTHPLNMLLKKEKEEVENMAAPEGPEASATPHENAPAASTAGEQVAQEVPLGTEGPTASPMTGIQSISGADQQDPALTAEEARTSTSEMRSDAPEKAEEEEKAREDKQDKKIRALAPPVVPEENLRLIVSIIAARECSKRTFQQTVATISNLKAIPGAKHIFGKGLIEQAQDLSQSILDDLDELLPQIKHAESGTDIQGLALTKFATASSDQSKLLRVLTALDYLFGPKPDNKSSAGEKDSHAETLKEDDLLTSLYENSTFGPLWEKLSECLSAIRQGEGMLNIASILQPLIEALMVVCKNTTLRDAPLVKAQKEFAISSPAPESRMESLFFKFTEEHRKVLNELVRHSPRLMMGTFSLLVKNPKVLEFDNKRSYFTKRLHSRGTDARHGQPPLQLSVRRDQVFLDSFKFLSFKTGDEIKYGKLSIRFHGEEGVDAGGVTREWFQVLSRQMFNPDYALFIPVASDRTTFHPNKLSKVNEEHLMFFKFIGRIIGKALYEGRALDCHFSRAVYKRILGKPVSIKDMETLDLDYYKSLLWMLENDITEIITETFSVETDDFGVTEIVDLIENGRNIPVTEENKQEYVQLMVEYRLTGSVQTQLAKFLEGFHDIVSPELISIFNEQELELLISGLPDIDVDDWKTHTEYHNYQAASAQIQWFWRAVRSFDKEERAKLLQFVTGTSKVPLNGFGQLEGMNGFSKFNIHRDYGNKERLPSSHTCFNQLDLPEYGSYEALRSHVYTAMTAGSEYFGFA